MLCDIDDIAEGTSKGFDLDADGGVFAVRKDGVVYCYRNRCPHAGLELNWAPDRFLDRDKEYILCTAHGAMFDITSGLCIAGPCAGAELLPVDYQIVDRKIQLQL